MKRQFHPGPAVRNLLGLVISLSAALPLPALAAMTGALKLATEPLASTTTSGVLPNLMFIIDGSGSMDWNYLPDWANDSVCRSTSGNYNSSCVNQPPFKSPDFNGQYYNPAIRYTPAMNADGTSKPSQGSPWTSVKNDQFNVQSTGSTNLITGFYDLEWCTSTSYTDCLTNGNYILPGVVNSKNYIYSHNISASGTQNVVTGAPDAPVITAKPIGPHYYTMTPGEYCTTERMTDCTLTQSATYNIPAKLRWCNSDSNASAIIAPANSCQVLRTGSFTKPRYPTRFFTTGQPYIAPVTGSPGEWPTGFITFSGTSTNNSSQIKDDISSDSIRLGGNRVEKNDIYPGNNKTPAQVASAVVSAIGTGGNYKAYIGGNNVTAACAAKTSNVVCLVDTTTYSNGDNIQVGSLKNFGDVTYTTTNTTGGVAAVAAVTGQPYIAAGYPGNFTRTDIVPSVTSYPKASGRNDCAGATCTYTEEMTNFANWWTYYQTRMQAMKSSASIAFRAIDNRYRVGFIDLWGNNYLPIAKFDNGVGSVKANWYAKLFSINPNNGTPLRSALTRVGRIFAGKKPVGSADPVEYACQKNFALLTTDGYWNTDGSSDVENVTGGQVGNMDGGSTARPMYEGASASSNSLADAAKYYYETDLRTSAFGNCTGTLSSDVCGTGSDTVQTMTTYTLGLGVEGTLLYSPTYDSDTTGDFADIKSGAANWSVPAADSEKAVDDLWHAAVNGGGKYFSAKNPAELTSGLLSALTNIISAVGSGAAAATSTLNPIAGDNFAYVASFSTVKWIGNLEARTIDLNSGIVSRSAAWCVEDILAGICQSPGTLIEDTSGGASIWNCTTTGSTAATCDGTLDASNVCRKQMPTTCTGTLRSKVGNTSDTRNIWFRGATGGSALDSFTFANLGLAGKATNMTGGPGGTALSQWSLLDATQQAAAANGNNMVNFLRGQQGFEDRSTNVVGPVDNRVYRLRQATLGDAVESQPAYVGKPVFKYTDTGYTSWAAGQAGRAKTVFMGANDGMLHAFNAVDGTERWAYVPSMVIPNMWKLADKNYSVMHTNYVNGMPIISDIETSAGSGNWKSILVAGLNGGGRGYYALDVTDPANPKFMWELDASSLPNLGYTFGPPVVTKRGTQWVVLLSSGYNNGTHGADGVTVQSPAGDGKGYLYIRDANTGAAVGSPISTGVGSAAIPSGLSKLAAFKVDPNKNNSSQYVYGGDLEGNVWRFDIIAGSVMKFATTASGQSVTSTPELGVINKKRVVFVATGKYLEITDLSTTGVQSLYAIQDDDAASTFTLPGTLVQQTLSTSGSTRTATSNTVNFTTKRGWYLNWPDSGERNHVDAILDSGLLIVPTTVPSGSVCSPAGYGWLNYFDYTSGSNGANIVSQKYNAPIVGLNVFYTPNGKRHISAVTSNDPTPKKPDVEPPQPNSSGFAGKRIIWRELVN